jgi:hypothetical protein
VRIGRAVAVAVGRTPEEFDAAWRWNRERQGTAAAENPYVGVLVEFFRSLPEGEAVSPGAIAKRISEQHRETFPKGVTAQQVGNEIARARATLERLGLRIGRKLIDGSPRYFRRTAETGSLGSLLESFSDEKKGVNQGVNPQWTSGRGSLPSEQSESEPPQAGSLGSTGPVAAGSLSENRAGSEPSEPSEPPLKVPRADPDPEDLFAGRQTRADKARTALAIKPEEPRGNNGSEGATESALAELLGELDAQGPGVFDREKVRARLKETHPSDAVSGAFSRLMGQGKLYVGDDGKEHYRPGGFPERRRDPS